MIIWGDADGVIPVSHAHAAHDLIEHSRLEILHEVGHFPHVEAPEAFSELLIDFIESSDPGDPVEETLRDVIQQHSRTHAA